ncbi:MAG TPA: ATP synthase subunit I [Bdellovibrionota bacterium]|nr:ATP synthase subunit I [Bdellovibrionota bacterium]
MAGKVRIQTPKFTKRVLTVTGVSALLVALIGFIITKNQGFAIAALYGGGIGLLNFWILILLVTQLLTEGKGFDYKSLCLLLSKIVILFGGLAAGFFIFHFHPLPLMAGFFSFFIGLLLEGALWMFSAISPKEK